MTERSNRWCMITKSRYHVKRHLQFQLTHNKLQDSDKLSQQNLHGLHTTTTYDRSATTLLRMRRHLHLKERVKAIGQFRHGSSRHMSPSRSCRCFWDRPHILCKSLRRKTKLFLSIIRECQKNRGITK